MKCALAAMGFINGNIEYNKAVIIKTLNKWKGNADVVIFGEAFLQGFYGVDFTVEHDSQVSISCDDPIIKEICAVAKDCSTAVSFGFIEKDNNLFYSSQITIDQSGHIIDLYRRVSEGWKEKTAGKEYCEGEGFHTFVFMGKKIAVGLCGDLWYDDNLNSICALKPDQVWWPVYTDFNDIDWNETTKFEYAEQVRKIGVPVLYVNSVCIDKSDEVEIAKGGAALFYKGNIEYEIASGAEGILFVES